MRTIYIKGIKKYKVSLVKGLEKSDLNEGYDYIQGSGGDDHALYWINEHVTLRDFKLAIGAKFVFKHRMRFFDTIDEMKPSIINEAFDESEKKLLSKIRRELLEQE